MRKWTACTCVALMLICVPVIAYAQSEEGGGPRRGREESGPGRNFGPQGRGRLGFGRAPGFMRPGPFAPGPQGEAERGRAGAPSAAPAPQPPAGPQAAPAPQPFERHHFAFGQHLSALRRSVGPVGALLILLVALPVLVMVLWVLPVTLGVWIARRRKLSGLWMLFGIHPVGGWVACLVLALSRSKVECATCGGYVRRNFRQCPLCHGAVPAPTPPKPL